MHSSAQLRVAIEKITTALGFQYYAVGHHVRSRSHRTMRISGTIRPHSRTQLALQGKGLSEDPVICSCERSAVGFLWSDIHRIVNLTKAQDLLLSQAKTVGLTSGITIPLHVPGEHSGSCSFVVPQRQNVQANALLFGHYLGSLAFEKTRGLATPTKGISECGELFVPLLSARQRECLALAAQGKTDIDVGQFAGDKQRDGPSTHRDRQAKLPGQHPHATRGSRPFRLPAFIPGRFGHLATTEVDPSVRTTVAGILVGRLAAPFFIHHQIAHAC